MERQIDTHTSLAAFFHELLREALAAERLELSNAATAYLLQLCTDYADRDTLYAGTERDERGTPALAFLYQRAITSAPRERFDAFRRLGDLALMVSGFFAAQLERSLVDVSYYVKMGGSAYSAAATLSRGSGFAQVLGQLSGRYPQLVEVLTRVAEGTTLPVAKDVAALYDRWLRNPKSADLERRLIGGGLIPCAVGEVA